MTISDVSIDEPSTSKIILDVMAPVMNENSIDQLDNILFSDAEFKCIIYECKYARVR